MIKDSMHITVILCTFNRAQSLARALKSILAQKLPQGIGWEILVVDSSKDDTRNVVEQLCVEHPGRIRYIFEPKPGKSNALNTGIREASGYLLAFTDDDVTVGPTWLANLTAALHRGEWVGAGGRVMLDWTCPRPRWLQTKGMNTLEGVLAGFDQGDQSGELTTAPFGANMAFRKEMFEAYGGFRTDMGCTRGVLATSEDTEFGRRLMAAGHRLRYEPEAIVYHPVPKNRLRKQYFQDFWFDYGRAVILEFGIPEAHHHWWGVPRHLFRKLIEKTLRWTLTFRPYDRFFSRMAVWQTAGEIVQIHRQSKQASFSSAGKDNKAG